MKPDSSFSLLALAALCAASTACFCNADEQLSVSVGSADSLTITGGGVSMRLQLNGRIGEWEIAPSSFRTVFDAVQGRTVAAEGVAMTLQSWDAEQQTLLVLALPATLRRDDLFQVGGAFPIQPTLSTDPGIWGAHDLADANQAEVGFVRSTYSFPPPTHTASYRATNASGTVRVVGRSSDWMMLDVSVNLIDAEGNPATISGRVQAQAERYTPPCT